MKAQQALYPQSLAPSASFGDIGTSPLYALGSSLSAAEYLPGETAKVLGLLSLIFWSLAIVVTAKYVGVIMRADNAGEGGVLSLVALVQKQFGTATPWVRHAVALGVLGTALFYCDALITPAVSVLSAARSRTSQSGFCFGGASGDPGRHRHSSRSSGAAPSASAGCWSGHGRVVRGLALLGIAAIVRARRAAAVNPLYGLRLLVAHPASVSRSSEPSFSRSRDAKRVCRYGPLRTPPGTHRLAGARLARAGAQLLRSGALLLNSAGAIANPFYALAPRARCRFSCCCPPRPR
jgi:KUP system potassium uptake protein